jgi:hypothetical protein
MMWIAVAEYVTSPALILYRYLAAGQKNAYKPSM